VNAKTGRQEAASPDRHASTNHLPLPIAQHFEPYRSMENHTGPAATIRSFARWATTPPQAYAAYFIALVLVAGLSFYVGTLRPKKPVGLGPPPVTVPRN
jgi:hypothetical protein